MFKRYIIEFGTGVDLHGMDVTKAAQKAVKDAISHSCLCGLTEILGVDEPGKKMRIDLKIAAPFPEQVDLPSVVKSLPFSTEINTQSVLGGMTVPGLSVPQMGEGDQIVIVNAALTVYVWIEE